MYLRTSSSVLAAICSIVLTACGHSHAQSAANAPPAPQDAIARKEYEQLAPPESEAAGDLGSLNAQLHAARLNLEYTRVLSPIDGHVSRAVITSGNLVSNTNLLTTVVSADPIYAYFDTAVGTTIRFLRQ